MTRFEKVKELLDAIVGSRPVRTHREFWRGKTRDEFVGYIVFGEVPLLVVGDGAGSNLVKALKGEPPFGDDPGSLYRRMPAGRPPATPEQIAFIERWIDEGCLEDPVPPAEGGPAPQGLTREAEDSTALHVLYWRELDNWSLLNRTPEVNAAINYFMPRTRAWTRFAAGSGSEAQWVDIVVAAPMQQHLRVLSVRQKATVVSFYGEPMDAGLLGESFQRFGAGSLPRDDLRPDDPIHQMDDGYQWFIWSAFADACIRSRIDAEFWREMSRFLLIGLCNDGVFRRSFNVTGFEASEMGQQKIRAYAAALTSEGLPAELAARFRASGF